VTDMTLVRLCYPKRPAQMQRNQHHPKLPIGSRFRLSALGIERCPKLKSHTGTIVGANPSGTSFRILIDGRKLPLTLHESYIEPEESPGTDIRSEQRTG
jgi:hypothetical protein